MLIYPLIINKNGREIIRFQTKLLHQKHYPKKSSFQDETSKTKALFDKLLKMFKPLKMKIFNGFNFSIYLITKF